MKEKLKGNNYVNWGLTLFGVIASSILVVFIFLKIDTFIDFIFKILNILTPIFLGVLFAYLLNPLVELFDKYVSKHVIDFVSKKVLKKLKNKKRASRILSITLTYLLALIIIILFIKFVLPSLFDSLNVMFTSIPTYINNIYKTLQEMLASNPELMNIIDKLNTNISDSLANFMVPSMDTIMTNITLGISSFIKWTINILIGLIVSIYLLYDKDPFISGFKKIMKVTMPKKIYETSMTTLGYVDKVFGGFMIAKIIDSLIIGVLTFVVISIFKIPYALIISVIVGVTNIIPYFGPFIGAIPCIALLLLIDPTKSFTFAILILLIQQFDGNILGPKLIGNRTGIKSFWVLFSILLFGGLFGFIGMLFGVPVFAVIYSIVNNLVNKKLAKLETL